MCRWNGKWVCKTFRLVWVCDADVFHWLNNHELSIWTSIASTATSFPLSLSLWSRIDSIPLLSFMVINVCFCIVNNSMCLELDNIECIFLIWMEVCVNLLSIFSFLSHQTPPVQNHIQTFTPTTPLNMSTQRPLEVNLQKKQNQIVQTFHPHWNSVDECQSWNWGPTVNKAAAADDDEDAKGTTIGHLHQQMTFCLFIYHLGPLWEQQQNKTKTGRSLLWLIVVSVSLWRRPFVCSSPWMFCTILLLFNTSQTNAVMCWGGQRMTALINHGHVIHRIYFWIGLDTFSPGEREERKQKNEKWTPVTFNCWAN